MSETVAAREPPRVPALRIILYALPGLPAAALALPVTAYLPQLYAASPHLSLGVVAAVFAASKIWDVVTDPVMGHLSDATSTRWGRRRPWMAAGLPILLLAGFFLLVWPQWGGAEPGAIYLLLWLLVLYTGWTMYGVAHLAWGAELSSDYDERSRILGTREAAFFLGTLLALVLPAIVERSGGDQAAQVASIGWLALITLPVVTAATFWGVQEPPATVQSTLPAREGLRVLMRNRAYQRLLAADFLLTFGYIATATMFRWLIRDVLGFGTLSGTLLFFLVLGGVIGVPIFVWLSHRIGKHQTMIVACCLNVLVVPSVLFLPAGNLAAVLGFLILLALPLSTGAVMSRAIAADVVDQDRLETGRERAGTVFALTTTTNKIGNAAGIAVTLGLLQLIGFDPDSAIDAATGDRFRILYVALIVTVNVLIALTMFRFPLDRKRHAELRAELDVRREATAPA